MRAPTSTRFLLHNIRHDTGKTVQATVLTRDGRAAYTIDAWVDHEIGYVCEILERDEDDDAEPVDEGDLAAWWSQRGV